ncbi:MAG: DNA helicase UvrD [Candidatus Omnitrophota bacterium]|nr:MAG: DNA helicase UvrD [Candidatus Omnitrophota bacterium]
MFIADFHIHSRYSRATSKEMDVEHLVQWARWKGIKLLGTGDWTHHLWLEELKAKLEPLNNGLFIYKGIYFILSTEVSNIYFKYGKTRRVHNLIFAPSFKVVDKINSVLSTYGDLSVDGRPVLSLDCQEMVRIILDICADCFIVPAHAWTPWFGIFGSQTGFDKIEECFDKQTPNIYALETGLSSDPAMNWRWSALDRFALISNSDAHSPVRLGREANAFDCELDYYAILKALKQRDKRRFLFTIEFFPQEGKYHFDGHRSCSICFSPQQTREHNNLCPKCGRPLTVGVMNRVEQLADRPENFQPEQAIPFKSLIPLEEIIAEAYGVGKETRGVQRDYLSFVQNLGNEFEILLTIPEQILRRRLPERVSEGIIRVREGKVDIRPGYDGEYGKITIFPKEKEEGRQMSLF